MPIRPMTVNAYSLLLLACLLTAGAPNTAAEPSDPSASPQLWVTYPGATDSDSDKPGHGKRIVLISGDDEYRSEEALPMLGKILATHHGFHCDVLFAIDPADGTIKPDHQTNIPGMHLLDDADLAIVFLRYRRLPDEQMKHFVDFVNSGKPIIGLRTATHAFHYGDDRNSPYAKFSCDNQEWPGGFGQQVLGDTWINHHGDHGKQSTRGVPNPEHKDHPILRGVTDVWGPTDVYEIRHLKPSAAILLFGQVLEGMSPQDKPVEGGKNDPMMPLAWCQEYTGEAGKSSRVFCTTMGASQDFQSEGLRRLLVNACYWGLGMEDQITPKGNVEYVGSYNPTRFGFGSYTRGKKPSDFE